ncbi:hypothetical protein BJV82DRAFT_117826 [Fennellomyces sp. T-0311]|nr:hypothetical protein BJV82DRAFT_117826 [Fennellomyces sp. T-0311]
MHLLRLLGPQLTTLDLQCNDTWVDQNKDKEIFLDPLLTLCPNLKHLYLDFSRCRSHLSFNMSKLSGPLELETLSTNFGEREHVLEQLIPQCPSLLSFHARSIAFRTLSLLDQHCPNLKQLHIRPFFSHSPTKGRDQRSASGLEEIHCIISDVSQIHSLAPILVKSKDSLQVLGLQLSIPLSSISVSEISLALPDIEYSQLKNFKCQAERFDDSISRIIRQCNTLRRVVLQIGGSIPNDLFQALTNLSHLRRLEIFTRTDGGGLENFIAYHSALGQRSTLRTIKIHGCDSVTDQILHSLADLLTLQTIMLQGPFLLTSSEGISTFVRKLEANANLKYLSFEQIEDLTDSLAVDLEHTTCLKMKKCLTGEPSFRGLYFGSNDETYASNSWVM